MFFLFRALFWIGVVMLFLPLPPSPPAARQAHAPHQPAAAALTGQAAADAVSFCIKRPETCRSGAETAGRLGLTMEQGTRLLSGLLADPAPVPPAAPPVRPKKKAGPPPAPGHGPG